MERLGKKFRKFAIVTSKEKCRRQSKPMFGSQRKLEKRKVKERKVIGKK